MYDITKQQHLGSNEALVLQRSSIRSLCVSRHSSRHNTTFRSKSAQAFTELSSRSRGSWSPAPRAEETAALPGAPRVISRRFVSWKSFVGVTRPPSSAPASTAGGLPGGSATGRNFHASRRRGSRQSSGQMARRRRSAPTASAAGSGVTSAEHSRGCDPSPSRRQTRITWRGSEGIDRSRGAISRSRVRLSRRIIGRSRGAIPREPRHTL